MIGLSIETSCDETAASIIKDGREVLSNVVATQIDIHKKYGGVVPEIASRKHISTISQVVEEALNEGVKQKLISEETKKQFQKSKQINSQYPGIRMVDSSTIDFDHPEGTIDEIRQWFSEWANNTVANKIDRRTENVIARGIKYRNVA